MFETTHVCVEQTTVPAVTGFPQCVPRVPNKTDTWLTLFWQPCHVLPYRLPLLPM